MAFGVPGYNEVVGTVSFEQARECVISKVRHFRTMPPTETIKTSEATGRVLAESVLADRDYPPVPRSARDGFALRAQDLPGEFQVIGEVRAGEVFNGAIAPHQAVEIMTGAPVPQGANAVVMVEHCRRNGDTMASERVLATGDNISPKASEATSGEVVVQAGRRLGFTEIAELCTVGALELRVYRPPRVAILSTGDEVIDVHQQPLNHQVRNSNAHALAVQVRRAGGDPVVLPIARDIYDSTRELVERGLECDLLLLSGGVSAGKYDIVERVLADLGAEFYFDRVLIQPGQPLVFGRARDKFFFGLPGNPASTMVCFEVFGRAAVELLAGRTETVLPMTWSRLSREFQQKTGLRRFLPARLSCDGSEVTPVAWRGSSDVPALARSNAFLVTEPDRETWAAGELIRVLPQ